MEHVWTKIEDLRARYETLREDRTPIDVFAFFEIDLGLDPIPRTFGALYAPVSEKKRQKVDSTFLI
jgi:hypothetical protein